MPPNILSTLDQSFLAHVFERKRIPRGFKIERKEKPYDGVEKPHT
jgi:hypothetical protein